MTVGAAFALALVLMLAAAPTARADMPPAARQLIDTLKLGPEVTAGWEAEQAVPRAWVEGARREAKLRVNGSWEPKAFQAMAKPFFERYPFIKPSYMRGSNNTRVGAALVAFGEGRTITDVITGIDSSINQFRELGALADLGDLPNIRNIPEAMRSADNLWTSARLRYWCMAYNPHLIAEDHMPRRWEDLIANRELADGKLALWRGVSSWLLPLWHAKGEEWASDYVRQLFRVVRPQKRTEGAVALVNLVIAGEFTATLAAAEYHVKERSDRGAPIAFHCPDVVPITASTIGVLKDNPDINASRLFVNWLLSKEGQLGQYAAEGSPPVHGDLQKLGFMPFPGEIAGKQIAFRNPELLDEDIKAMFRVLNPYWEGSAAPAND